MINKYFDDENIKKNDLFFMCYMIERVSRRIKQQNRYVVNNIGNEQLYHLMSLANVLHAANPKQVEEDWINEYNLKKGDFDILDIDKELCTHVPTALDMGKVYTRLIIDTALPNEDFVSGMIRVYNNEICEIIDNYNPSAYYEPSYIIARAYNDGGF